MLPIFHTDSKDLSLLQTQWSSQLNPVLVNPIVQGQQINGVRVASGDTVINHGLGRNLQGWFVVGVTAAVDLYDKQATNQTPQNTLIIHSSGSATVNLWVY